jgi:hypothetical protein
MLDVLLLVLVVAVVFFGASVWLQIQLPTSFARQLPWIDAALTVLLLTSFSATSCSVYMQQPMRPFHRRKPVLRFAMSSFVYLCFVPETVCVVHACLTAIVLVTGHFAGETYTT